MFAYCGNNPVTRTDEAGQFWTSIAIAGYVFTALVDIVQVCATGDDAITPAYTKNQASVQISNSYKINTGIVQYGYCFYLNHFSEYKDYFEGTTGGMVFEWFIHNVGHKWYGLKAFGEKMLNKDSSDSTKSKERCADVDLGPTIYHDSQGQRSHRSTGMKVLYSILFPLHAEYDCYMYTLN